eukprot:154211-Pleurochrysis_carterae.AAC.2
MRQGSVSRICWEEGKQTLREHCALVLRRVRKRIFLLLSRQHPHLLEGRHIPPSVGGRVGIVRAPWRVVLDPGGGAALEQRFGHERPLTPFAIALVLAEKGVVVRGVHARDLTAR